MLPMDNYTHIAHFPFLYSRLIWLWDTRVGKMVDEKDQWQQLGFSLVCKGKGVTLGGRLWDRKGEKERLIWSQTCNVRLLLSSVWIHALRVSSVMKIWAALANRTGASALIICTKEMFGLHLLISTQSHISFNMASCTLNNQQLAYILRLSDKMSLIHPEILPSAKRPVASWMHGY